MKYIKNFERIIREDYVMLNYIKELTNFDLNSVYIVTEMDYGSQYPYKISTLDFEKYLWVKKDQIRIATKKEIKLHKIKMSAKKYNI